MKKLIAVGLALLLSACTTGMNYLPAALPIMDATAVSLDNGSGTVIAGNLLLTAKHVVAVDGEQTMRLRDGTERLAKTVWKHPTEDVAVMRFDGTPLNQAATIDCKPAEWGEPFSWIGNPSALRWNLRFGYVSSPGEVSWDGSEGTMIAVAAHFNPGDSGSGLFSPDGEIRGVVHAFMTSIFGTGLQMHMSQSGNGIMIPASAFCAELVAGLGAGELQGQ